MGELGSSWLRAPQFNITQFMSTDRGKYSCKNKLLFSLSVFLCVFLSLFGLMHPYCTYLVSHPEPLAMLGYHCKTGQWNQMAAWIYEYAALYAGPHKYSCYCFLVLFLHLFLSFFPHFNVSLPPSQEECSQDLGENERVAILKRQKLGNRWSHRWPFSTVLLCWVSVGDRLRLLILILNCLDCIGKTR